MPLIKLDQAGKRYLNHRFDLMIERSDFVLVSGENGNGKTTLIHLIMGFTRPDMGKVMRQKMKIGYLPEKAMLPLFVNVNQYLKTLARIKKTEIDRDLVSAFRLPVEKSIHELSKGNQQKLAIVSTFLGKPDLIILDEPLTGLDDESAITLKSHIEKKKKQGMSFVVSTHQPNLFIHLANQHLKL